ncbi:uncharacterized protein LOC135213043 [Macrobrachium nipponense]|uniref:uncharacterized protein LOC135213043 n=1 Tax=Macrobrachium nipponense TaxID=159736 RepID=UPI0030C82A23
MSGIVRFLVAVLWVTAANAQDYQVADINCDFEEESNWTDEGPDTLSARLKKPPGFKGHPLFADDRRADPLRDETCQIRQDIRDPSGLVYNLLVTDLDKCGTIKKNGYVHLRIWFPQLEGVVLATDQEVIIMCKPASPTIIENRAAGFAGALPSSARVSGVVEESPGRLQYEVALFRAVNARSGQSHSPVNQAVPIGSRLQLRARINTDATWKYAKLMEVTVSGDPANPYSPGHVSLVKDGCRLSEFESIVPQQPQRTEDQPGEVRLDFEAFMLDAKMAGSSQLWIHATIKACIEPFDCRPELCLDLRHPSGHGRRKRRKAVLYADGLIEMVDDGSSFLSTLLAGRETSALQSAPNGTDALVEKIEDDAPDIIGVPAENSSSVAAPLWERPQKNNNGSSAKIGNNVPVTVIMPEEFFTNAEAVYQSCGTFVIISTFLGATLLLASGFLCFLTSRLHKTVARAQTSSLDTVVKEHHNKYGVKDVLSPPFLSRINAS